ncbi:hypothetical protein GPECTOR_13g682 [Gonium pectorale]|uniref:Endonuclease/exonuclease/phosphatase domain-containing protein n=1 Tax=Gonium pectorale TaxID=33097 RepID=A0A150GN40_GONPE|nr:hypothetical protein GPECTOR_13g682 [Gonium pectorale]|eukprot:KXZ51195.1 hypothetical protein GPECTOR_13g682 [Gonium pectorale]
MSWNVLAAELAHTHAAELYPQTHPDCLAWPGRLAAVVRHVREQRPDVLCLQEVDDWQGVRAALAALGYDGVHAQRTGGRGDGCATLWRRDRLCVAKGAAGSRGPGGGGGRGGEAAALQHESRSSRSRHGVHTIRMADHDLRDNVALLVHLQPRAGAGAGAGRRRVKRSRSSSSGDDGGGDGPARRGGGGNAPGPAGASAAAAAATAAMSDLWPASRGGGGTAAAAGPSVCRLPGPLRRGFWVANTHVLFNTKRGDIKLGQLRVILTELAERAGADSSSSAAAAVGASGCGEAPDAGASSSARNGSRRRGGRRGGEAAEEGGDDVTATPRPQAQPASASAAVAAVAAAGAGAGPLPCIFAGDFNAAPGSGLYRFLRGGCLQLSGEDRRELSGQVEGYGYSSLQRDVRSGRPPRLARWEPPPAAEAAEAEVEEGRQPRRPQQQPAGPFDVPMAATAMGGGEAAGAQGFSPGPYSATRRSYSVRWDMEELTYAMGRTALAAAMTSAAAAAGAATVQQQQPATPQGASPWPGPLPSGPPGWAPGASRRNGGGGGGRGGPARDAWPSLAEAAVVRHPLVLRSAYAAADPAGREPLFTTMHARYVGTVDFVWYTPGDDAATAATAATGGGSAGAGAGTTAGKRTAGSRDAGGGATAQPATGFSLRPVRVLHPPDPLSYPYGMPCASWPSDHVSLVVDFRLR